jgi:hypothetical protein
MRLEFFLQWQKVPDITEKNTKGARDKRVGWRDCPEYTLKELFIMLHAEQHLTKNFLKKKRITRCI